MQRSNHPDCGDDSLARIAKLGRGLNGRFGSRTGPRSSSVGSRAAVYEHGCRIARVYRFTPAMEFRMSQQTTRIDAIGEGLYRISTAIPPPLVPGGFTFNQYLLVDEAPLLFHTGPRGLFSTVSQAVSKVLALEELRYVAFCHIEADECG